VGGSGHELTDVAQPVIGPTGSGLLSRSGSAAGVQLGMTCTVPGPAEIGSHQVTPPRWNGLRTYGRATAAIVEKPGRKFCWISDPVLITPAAVLVCLREGKSGTVLVAGQADVVVHAVKMNEVQVRVVVCPAIDALMTPAVP